MYERDEVMKCLLSAVSVLVVVSSNLANAQIPEEIQKTLQKNFIGKWQGTMSYDGQITSGQFTAKWAKGKYCIVVIDQSGEDHRSGLIGWDSASKTLVDHGFVSNGNHFTIRWDKFMANKWTGTCEGVQDGKPFETNATVQWSGDSFEYRDNTLGKPLVFSGVRLKKAKQKQD